MENNKSYLNYNTIPYRYMTVDLPYLSMTVTETQP